jgi:hypothetical protein
MPAAPIRALGKYATRLYRPSACRAHASTVAYVLVALGADTVTTWPAVVATTVVEPEVDNAPTGLPGPAASAPTSATVTTPAIAIFRTDPPRARFPAAGR